MSLYGPDEMPLRRAIGFTAEGYVRRQDGDETTLNGIAPPKAEMGRYYGHEDTGHDEPICRKKPWPLR